MTALPSISKQELETASQQPDELINLLIKGYHDIISADPTQQVMDLFTMEQNVLMAFSVLDGQVSNGGFIQLIENKYGPYIFDTPLSEHLRDWGLASTADIIDRARVIYEAKKEILEREKSLEEFAKLYEEHKEFEPLEGEFSEVIASERKTLSQYILEHAGSFMTVE